MALAAFLADVERRAFKIAQYAVGDTEHALDIVQDAMLKLVDNYRLRPPEEWAPLFYRVLERRILDHHRRSTVQRRVLSFFGFGEDGTSDDETPPLERIADTPAAQPEVRLAVSEDHARLAAAIRSLPLRQQQVVLLRDFEGLDVNETATAMGCSAGSVKTHYFRALGALRAALVEDSP